MATSVTLAVVRAGIDWRLVIQPMPSEARAHEENYPFDSGTGEHFRKSWMGKAMIKTAREGRSDDPGANGEGDRRRTGFDVELGDNGGDMVGCRSGADVQAGPDLLVALSFCQQPQHIDLTMG